MGSVEVLVVVAPEDDDERRDQLTRRLRAELACLEIDRIAALGRARPPGAKSGDAGSVSQLLVTLTASGGVLARLVGLLSDWVGRQRGARLSVSIDGDQIELASATPDEQRQLVQAFLARHRGG
jgi:hypothetical protein